MPRKYINNSIIFLGLILWPLNLYLANTLRDFLTYAIPVLLVGLSYILYRKNPKYYLLPIILIGLFEKKLVLLPIIFCLIELVIKFRKEVLAFLIVSLAILIFQFSSYKGQTIFNKDYEAEQEILRNTQLYPNVLMARIFQNKGRIYLNKLSFNFFALTDPNNYFFGFHPRQITISNQNLYKYPFFAFVFILYGIFYVEENSQKKFVIVSSISSLITLSVLNNFDRNDFILWVPLSLVFIHGVGTLSTKNKRLWKILSILFTVFAIPQILRSFIERFYQ